MISGIITNTKDKPSVAQTCLRFWTMNLVFCVEYKQTPITSLLMM
jgi:hypothetical protein